MQVAWRKCSLPMQGSCGVFKTKAVLQMYKQSQTLKDAVYQCSYQNEDDGR